MIDRTIELKDQLRDYKFKGDKLENMNFFEFMLNIYKDSKDSKDDTRPNDNPADGAPKM